MYFYLESTFKQQSQNIKKEKKKGNDREKKNESKNRTTTKKSKNNMSVNCKFGLIVHSISRIII